MAEKICNGDCLKCGFQQQVYCSAQRTHALLENQKAIVERLDMMQDLLSGFTTGEVIPLAQSGDGAESRSPETK